MPTYRYKAKKGPLDTVEGSIEAQTEREAVEKLSMKGYTPLKVRPQTRPAELRSAPSGGVKGRVSSREITILSRQLASLLKSGVPILRAINIISEQTESPALKSILNNIHDAVKEGTSFSSALEQYPKQFSRLYVAIIRSGENSGMLPEALLRISDHRAKQEAMMARFRMAMAYPLLMAVVGTATIVFMLTFVMPRLMNIFDTLGENLPLPTQILIAISQTLRQWWVLIIVIIALFILVGKRQAGTRAGKLFFSSFILHVPLFGKFVLKAELARFNRTLSLLIKNGVSILKAIGVAIPVLENEILKNQFKKSYQELEQGGSFGRSLKSSAVCPPFMSNLLIVGEESGKLDEALAEIAGSYENETDEMIKIMSSLLEPLMILGMGLIVGFIVMAMLLPIFEINVLVR